MNWNLVSNIASIVTCVTFIVYIAGRFWAIKLSKEEIFSGMQIEEESVCVTDCIDLAGEVGRIFSITLNKGIRNIAIYEAVSNINSKNYYKKGKLLRNEKPTILKNKMYIRGEFTDVGSNLYFEITKSDYVKASFVVSDSGKDGSLTYELYENKMTFKSYLYYLVSK